MARLSRKDKTMGRYTITPQESDHSCWKGRRMGLVVDGIKDASCAIYPMKNSNRTFTAEEIQERLRSNKSLMAANPGILLDGMLRKEAIERSRMPQDSFLANSEGQDSGKAPRRGKRRKEMNATELEFSKMLDRQVDDGEILGWRYEGLTLRWGSLDNIQYTSDFYVEVSQCSSLYGYPFLLQRLIEVKGGHIWAKDIQKFKAARNQWPRLEFQMWQKKNREWTQIL